MRTRLPKTKKRPLLRWGSVKMMAVKRAEPLWVGGCVVSVSLSVWVTLESLKPNCNVIQR